MRQDVFGKDPQRSHDLRLRQRAEINQHADLGDADVSQHPNALDGLLRATHHDATRIIGLEAKAALHAGCRTIEHGTYLNKEAVDFMVEKGVMLVPTRSTLEFALRHPEAWSKEMVMKVKEPITSEYDYFREGLILFTYLHLASEAALTKALVKSKVIGIAYAINK